VGLISKTENRIEDFSAFAGLEIPGHPLQIKHHLSQWHFFRTTESFMRLSRMGPQQFSRGRNGRNKKPHTTWKERGRNEKGSKGKKKCGIDKTPHIIYMVREKKPLSRAEEKYN
jgi:hypothetical protein